MSSLGLQPGLGASTSVLFTYNFPMMLWISYNRHRFKIRVRTF